MRHSTLCLALGLFAVTSADAAYTANPESVSIPGDLDPALGCPAAWQPECPAAHLMYDADDDVWQKSATLPAGNYQYKAAINDGWAENYGAGGAPNGPNLGLSLTQDTAVRFLYDHKTHWITDTQNSVLYTLAGNFQKLLGCTSDNDPSCLRSWLQGPQTDGSYVWRTDGLPAGSYQGTVATGEVASAEDPAVSFDVAQSCSLTDVIYNPVSKVITAAAAPGPTEPVSVTIAGDLQSELGCAADWDPACVATHLDFDVSDGVWQKTFTVPAGTWEFKAPINDGWAVNYGANAMLNGQNIGLTIGAEKPVKFYYSDATHWLADNQNKTIVVLAGSFQSEVGCSGDWDPSCLRTWLQDPDGDGVYTFSTKQIPPGNWEVKVAQDENWTVNYGENGAPNGANIHFSVPSDCVRVFFSYNSTTHVLTVSTDGELPGNLAQAKAHWLSKDLIAWKLGDVEPGTIFKLGYAANGGMTLDKAGFLGADGELALTVDPTGIPTAVLSKVPHLAGYAALRLAATDLSKIASILKGQIAIAEVSKDGKLLDATSLQIPGVLDDLYTYSGELGVVLVDRKPTLRVWAPTAKTVSLRLFSDANPSTQGQSLPMTLDPATGVWSIAGEQSWLGKYYLYDVSVFVPSTQKVENNLVTDPYSVSLAADSARSQIIDLNDRALKPEGWDRLRKPPLAAPEDIVSYELHVRDFSINDRTVPASERGTFKAFTERNSDGMKHLRRLADAGLSHIQILPANDFGEVPERRADQKQTPDLSGFAPNSAEQQAAVAAIANQDGFNWGYNPIHYGVPEGSYATNPDGPARIREFRDMVSSLSENGLRVVMDVVFNHTNASGQSKFSVLDRIVPGYYHRLSMTGSIENSSCCANTATEHAMMGKLMVDSVVRWAKFYKVDGFRFDIMSFHMLEDMKKVKSALAALTLRNDGVDGKKIFVYGEGWNFGEVGNNARGITAAQLNLAGTGIGSFNDRIRDAIRGGGPFGGIQEQGFVNGLYDDPNATDQGPLSEQRDRLLLFGDQIRVSLAGNLKEYSLIDRLGNTVKGSQVPYHDQPAGYTADPQENISYAEIHDDRTLFDAIQLKAPLATAMADRVRMQNLGVSLVVLGQGVPVIHAGMDMLRSKSMDRDSYNSGDWFNKLDFTYATNNWGIGLPVADKNQENWPVFSPLLADATLQPGKQSIVRAADHFQEMLRIRTSSRLFRLRTADEIMQHLTYGNVGPNQVPGVIVLKLTDVDGTLDRRFRRIAVVFNATKSNQDLVDPSYVGTNFVLHPVLKSSSDPVVRWAAFNRSNGRFQVPAHTTAVFVERRPATEQIQLAIQDLVTLASNGRLNKGQANALASKLKDAVTQIGNGKVLVAGNLLKGFLSHLGGLASNESIDQRCVGSLANAISEAFMDLGN